MAEKIEYARIWTKVDTLENWNNNPLLLGPGEIALVTTPSGVPMNMKWGDKTTRKRFSDLPFAIAYEQGQFVAVSGTVLPASDGTVHYSLVGEGTYTRAGQTDVVVPTGKMGVIVDDGTTWILSSSVTLPMPSGTDVLNPIGEGIPKEKAVAEYIEPTISKVDSAIEFEDDFSSKLSTGDANVFNYETGTITGWGQVIGKIQNFDHIYLPKFKWTQAGYAITEARITIRDTSFTGAILGQSTAVFDGAINEVKPLLFTFPLIANTENKDIWVEVRTNGRLARANSTSAVSPRFSTNTNIATNFGTSSSPTADGVGFFIQAGVLLPVPKPTNQFMSSIKAQIPSETPFFADIVLPSFLYGVTGVEKNIYFKNFIYSNVSFDVLDIDVTCGAGHHMNDKLWILNTQTAGSFPLNITVSYNDTVLASKDVTLVVSNGVPSGNVSAIYISDSTAGLDGNIQSPVLKVISDKFATDGLKVTFKGTQGTSPTNHEARGGWKVLDYTTAGRTFYKFIVSGVTSIPNLFSTYTNNGSTFMVMETNVTAGSGYISCEKTAGTNLPLASGTLTRSTGLGDTSVAYSSYSTIAGNPFWNGTTSQVDFANYLTTKGITMVSNDWVVIHLGINDIFGSISLSDIEAVVTDRIAKLEILVNSIRSAVSGIKVGIAVNIPPTISQDAFGVSYYNGQTLYRYLRNLKIWQKALISKFDNNANIINKIYVFDYNTGVDRIYNFPKTVQDANSRNSIDKVTRWINGVHPAESGYQQMGDILWALMKVRG